MQPESGCPGQDVCAEQENKNKAVFMTEQKVFYNNFDHAKLEEGKAQNVLKPQLSLKSGSIRISSSDIQKEALKQQAIYALTITPDRKSSQPRMLHHATSTTLVC